MTAAAGKSLQSCPTLCDPVDGSPPGSPIPGILQARTLEWVAISFSSAGRWKVKVKSLSRVRLSATPWIAAHQAPLSMDFPGKSTGVGCHCLLQTWLISYYWTIGLILLVCRQLYNRYNCWVILCLNHGLCSLCYRIRGMKTWPNVMNIEKNKVMCAPQTWTSAGTTEERGRRSPSWVGPDFYKLD